MLNRSIIDEIVVVSDQRAFDGSRLLGRREGILAGVSSGAALHAAVALATRLDSLGKTIVVLLADSAERHVSSGLLQSSR